MQAVRTRNYSLKGLRRCFDNPRDDERLARSRSCLQSASGFVLAANGGNVSRFRPMNTLDCNLGGSIEIGLMMLDTNGS